MALPNCAPSEGEGEEKQSYHGIFIKFIPVELHDSSFEEYGGKHSFMLVSSSLAAQLKQRSKVLISLRILSKMPQCL